MHENWTYGNNGENSWVAMLFMLTLMTILIIGVVIVIRHFTQNSSARYDHETAMDVLNKRYATGELNKKEFDEMRNHIG